MQERQVSVGVLNKRVFAFSGGGRSDEVGEKGALPRIQGFPASAFSWSQMFSFFPSSMRRLINTARLQLFYEYHMSSR